MTCVENIKLKLRRCRSMHCSQEFYLWMVFYFSRTYWLFTDFCWL